MSSEQTRDTVDTGYVRSQVIEELQRRGNTVTEDADCLIVNNNASISLSDSLIDLLANEHLYTTNNFADMIMQQYEYTMSHD